ncbi:HNH endonuclease [Undibacterium fentianense]|uniref:HNH endonuclease n=1 Tax=Undibacterium fentianense TaxID=2828728 RepID=A0A941E9N8_9BURK|nr:HNH endonuclease signature motif containing protein [Undibacterium fentianense]MBR7801158.1 HNH endonuclease [Undibacterium fentianense]
MSRAFFREPIPEIYKCAELIRTAVEAHISGNSEVASDLFNLANDIAVREWLESIWGKSSPYVKFKSVPNSLPILSKEDRLEVRMPSGQQKASLLRRDGFYCRFCEIPVIRKEVRHYLHTIYPNTLPWGRKNISQHAAFQVMWAQYDHIIPHARGGTNSLENMVITCAACNFGRMDFTLEEVGIEDPRSRLIKRGLWNGMEHVLPLRQRVEWNHVSQSLNFRLT